MNPRLTSTLRIPRNTQFEIADIEGPWSEITLRSKDDPSRPPVPLQPGSFDFIHARMLNGSVQSWPDMYSKIFK